MASGETDRISSGIEGLDRVLHGGFIAERGYMVRGRPGAGKSLLALEFLTAGDGDGDNLFINLEENREDIRRNAAAVGIDIDGIAFLDLSPDADVFTEGSTYSIFEPSDIEGTTVTGEIGTTLSDLEPDRVVVDPVTQLRYLTPNEYQFRKQITGLIQYLQDLDATVVFTSQASPSTPDDDMQFISHGVVELRQHDGGRYVRVPKFRGSDVESGWHTMRITDEGVAVYPSLVPKAHHREVEATPISSGVPALDALLHGGIERGTVTIISGPSGVGKTTLGGQFTKEAASRGERSVIYLFEESRQTFVGRSRQISIPVSAMEEEGTLAIREVEPLAMSADEFAHQVRTQVEEANSRLVMLDGTGGYRLSVRGPDEDLTRELHALCRYLKNMGVTCILIEETGSITGDFQPTERDISYLADNIVFLRYLERDGALHKTVGVLKKRMSDFERSLREFRITSDGITVGEPLTGLRGILRGTPEVVEGSNPSMQGR